MTRVSPGGNKRASTPREETPSTAPSRRASIDAVAKRAYEIFLDRGRAHGHDLDDWLQAEREVRVRAAVGSGAVNAKIDQALVQSFPASDPPPWTSGTAAPRPRSASQRAGRTKHKPRVRG